jgi:class 3 adenylate cyclase
MPIQQRAETDEGGTLPAIKAVFSDAIEPLILEHHGRIVKLMGDGVIVEFSSVVDAVTAAVAIQANLLRGTSEGSRS